jgi:hypothetical protein
MKDFLMQIENISSINRARLGSKLRKIVLTQRGKSFWMAIIRLLP